MDSIWDGVIVGGAGGAIAGLTVYLIQFFHSKIKENRERKRVYNWLKENTSDIRGERYRSTRAIASWNNLTQNRVKFLCSVHEKIYLSTGKKEDLWSIYIRSRKERDDEGSMVR